jgi:hypothetical protein
MRISTPFNDVWYEKLFGKLPSEGTLFDIGTHRRYIDVSGKKRVEC